MLIDLAQPGIRFTRVTGEKDLATKRTIGDEATSLSLPSARRLSKIASFHICSTADNEQAYDENHL
jgi:hypothetical protein